MYTVKSTYDRISLITPNFIFSMTRNGYSVKGDISQQTFKNLSKHVESQSEGKTNQQIFDELANPEFTKQFIVEPKQINVNDEVTVTIKKKSIKGIILAIKKSTFLLKTEEYGNIDVQKSILL